LLFKTPKVLLSVTAILFLIYQSYISQTSSSIQFDFYERGIAQRDSGNWQAALDIWLSARDSLTDKNYSDPRIGIAFIELATREKAADYYPQASEIYFWGLSQVSITKFKWEIGNEIKRIGPLLSEEEISIWLVLLEENDTKLNMKIKAFWVNKDPIPTTKMNERLIEHWERIASIRKNFKEDQTTIYGTDDRGLVFVKYGEPDKKFAGQLGTDQLEIMRWFPTDFLLRQEIQRFNNTPEVEIWAYSDLKKNGSTVFLFGKKSGFGKYGLKYGVEDFIPERAFRRSSTRTTGGVIPGTFIQLMYYSELINADRYFLGRFRELEALWANSRAAGELNPNRDLLLGLLNHYKSIDQDNIKFKHLVPDRTSKLEGLESLNLNYKAFRYLDDKNLFKLIIMATSVNQSVGENLQPVFFKPAKKTKYKYRHILLRYDESWQLKDKHIDYPALKNNNTSIFSLSQNNPVNRYKLVAEKIILDFKKAKLEKTDIPDTAKVIGISSACLGVFTPLSSDSTELEISDLIVGVKSSAELDQSIVYPFPVVPRKPVKQTDSLQVYLELYHLEFNSNLESSLRFDCEIKMVKGGKINMKRERLSKSFEVQVYDKVLKRTFALDISKLNPGNYEVTIKIIYKKTKQKKVRKSAFRIIG